MVFCDWVSAFVPLNVDWLYGDRIVKLKPLDATSDNRGDIALRDSSGKLSVEPFTVEYCCNMKLQVEGSFSDVVTVRSCLTPKSKDSSVCIERDDYRIEISGNPTKWFQGHNCFGSPDMVQVIRHFLIDVLSKVGIETELILDAIDRKNVLITRLDLCAMFPCADPDEWLRQSAQFFDSRVNRKRQCLDGSLMEGYGSRRLTSIVYLKAKEMEVHKSKFNLSDEAFAELHDFSSKHLRFEHKIKRMKLVDLNMGSLSKLRNEDMREIFFQLTNDLNIPDNIEITDSSRLLSMKRSHAGIYALWRNGADLRSSMPSATFKRWRRLFSDEYNIDIDMPPRNIPENKKVVALKRVITFGNKPFTPSVDTKYYFQPTLRLAA